MLDAPKRLSYFNAYLCNCVRPGVERRICCERGGNPIPQDPKGWSEFAAVASQYGPFFFALLFVIFVPFLGQRYFRDFLEQRSTTPEERQTALQVYKFYWLSGIVTGLVLVAASVAWWFYVQAAYVLPARIALVEATILEATDEDLFMYDVFSPDYRVYAYHVSWINPPVTKVAIVLKREPKPDQVLDLRYMTKAAYKAAILGNTAIKPAPVPFCLRHREMTLVRRDGAQPHFDKKC